MTLDPARVKELLDQHSEQLKLEFKGDSIFFTPVSTTPEREKELRDLGGPPYLSKRANRWEIKCGTEEARCEWIVKLNGFDQEPEEEPEDWEEEEEEEDKAEAKKEEEVKPEAPKPAEAAPKAEPERPSQGRRQPNRGGGGGSAGEGGQKGRGRDSRDLFYLMMMSDEVNPSMSREEGLKKLKLPMRSWEPPKHFKGKMTRNAPTAVMVVPKLLGEFFLACCTTTDERSREPYSMTTEEKNCTAHLPWKVPMTYCFRDGTCRLGFAACGKGQDAPSERMIEEILDNVLNVLARRKVLIYRRTSHQDRWPNTKDRNCPAIKGRDPHLVYVILQRKDDTPDKPQEIARALGGDIHYDRAEVLHKLW